VATGQLFLWSEARGEWVSCPPDEITWLDRRMLSGNEDLTLHRAPRCASLRYVHHRWELFSRDTTYRVYLAGASCQVPVSQSGVGRRHGTGVGTNSAMAPATMAGLSTGTHVLAPGTETRVARGKSDASRRACAIGKKSHASPQISRTGRSNRGIASAASMSSCGRKPAMAATRSPATCRSRAAGP